MTDLPNALLNRLTRRGWAITHLGQSPAGYWSGAAMFLTGSPDEDGPEFGFRVNAATREACVAELRSLVEAERAKGRWTEVADG